MAEAKRIRNVIVAQAALSWIAFNRRISEYLSGSWCPSDEPHYAESRGAFREVLDNAISALRQAIVEFDGVPRLVNDGDSGPNDSGGSRKGKPGIGSFEALQEARRRWGEFGFIRWRRAELQEILGREAKCERLFQVGMFVPSEAGERLFTCYGEGASWEEAFAEAAEGESDPVAEA